MSDEVKTSMGMTFVAFPTPDVAKVLLPGMELGESHDIHDLPSVRIEDLDDGAIDDLAAQWLTHLYARCERDTPWSRKAPTHD